MAQILSVGFGDRERNLDTAQTPLCGISCESSLANRSLAFLWPQAKSRLCHAPNHFIGRELSVPPRTIDLLLTVPYRVD